LQTGQQGLRQPRVRRGHQALHCGYCDGFQELRLFF
jgi:hypothetical protein